jgi:hypothetical protein
VTRPAAGNGPLPAIVTVRGWGGEKRTSEATTRSGNGHETYDKDIYCAEHGFAVLNYSARGWENSCGSEESRKGTPVREESFIRLAETRGKRPRRKRRWSSAKRAGSQEPPRIRRTAERKKST